MRNLQNPFERCKRSFISAFSICMTVPLTIKRPKLWINFTPYSNVSIVNFQQVNTGWVGPYIFKLTTKRRTWNSRTDYILKKRFEIC